ncbi:MAG: hypothetical protein JWQ34_332 [Mucilaginibacter sp.]|nr:hypothetical protein [Mucilaginibacter sp.]
MQRIWELGDLRKRQNLQKLVFPDGITYNKKTDTYRTLKINSFFSSISSLSAIYKNEKTRQLSETTDLSRLVDGTGQISNFLEDIQSILQTKGFY